MQTHDTLELEIEPREGNDAVARLRGRLDLASASYARDRLAEAIAQGHRVVVVDLQQVSSIDSSGLGALIGALKAARLAGGDLRIARPGEQARVILGLTTLDRVLRPYATVEEALPGR